MTQLPSPLKSYAGEIELIGAVLADVVATPPIDGSRFRWRR